MDNLRRDEPDSAPQQSELWRRAHTAHEELVLMGMPRVNLLLIGPDGVVRYALDMLLPHLHQPIVTRCAGDRLALQPIEHTGTLVLHSVGTLDRDDQRRLIEWLDRPWPRPQVVSTSPAPLLAEVERGVFFDSLYYRLNTVCLQL
jgi:hypothetical protein